MVVIADMQQLEPPGTLDVSDEQARAARRTLHRQVARLEADLAETLVAAFPRTEVPTRVAARGRGPRLLSLAELEILRDDLAARLSDARAHLAVRSESEQQARDLYEAMLLAPGKHRFVRVSLRDMGEPGCGVWHVKPRLGLIGMLAGWWHVKLSSGCPLRDRAVGKRSRKRGPAGPARKPVVAPTTQPPRAHAKRPSRRATLDELPAPPWAPFPLVELCVLLGFIFMGVGILAGGDRRVALIMGGVGLTCLAGLEQATREHFSGFRSHTTLLAGVCAAIVAAVTLAVQVSHGLAVALTAAAMAAAWSLLRRAFAARAGVAFRA